MEEPSGKSTAGNRPGRPPVYRMVVAGAGGVGKSSLCIRFVLRWFLGDVDYDPPIEDPYRWKHLPDEKLNLTPTEGKAVPECTLDIRDTAGQEEFSDLVNKQYQDGQCFMLVYSVTDRRSFDQIPEFRKRILDALASADSSNAASGDDDETMERKLKKTKRTPKGPPMVLVGNKTDLNNQREVSFEEASELAHNLFSGCPFFETSAKDDINVDLCFVTLVQASHQRLSSGHGDLDRSKKRKAKPKNDGGRECILS